MVLARALSPCGLGASVLCAFTLAAAPAAASGPGEIAPWYLDQFGGNWPDLAAHFDGRVGVLMTTAPKPMLYLDWRLLHGLPVGEATGEALSTPCCDTPGWSIDAESGSFGWLQARRQVPTASLLNYIDKEREGADHTSTANCFDDAFDLAAATLKDRIARYGAASPDVAAWLDGQDAVFDACASPAAVLPPAPTGAPAWLVKDRAYQGAAFDLYQGRNVQAARAFAAIAADPASPWRASGLYLAARALAREAVATQTPAAYAAAHAAVERLAAAGPEVENRDMAKAMRGELGFHEHPAETLKALEQALAAPESDPFLAFQFRDYVDLRGVAPATPEILDWIDTLRAEPASAPVNVPPEDAAYLAARVEAARRAALTHALDRWTQGHDRAWLVAALSLADPKDVERGTLLAAAHDVSPDDPAWLSLQYHQIRLTLADAPAAESRQRLDALLARPDLSVSDRNLFTAQRAQVAADLHDFARFALRRRLCADASQVVARGDAPLQAKGCVRDRWDDDDVQLSGVYDGVGDKGQTGLGADAQALIDRAPLAMRLALARDQTLPANLRLDLALTSFGRAVQMQDDAAADRASALMADLLPIMAAEFHDVVQARAGADKRFAEFLVLAKIPGVRVDLIAYTRPEGAHVTDFQTYWTDWAIPKAPGAGASPRGLAAYQLQGQGVVDDQGFDPQKPSRWPDAQTDLTCLGECGRGAAPLRQPDFMAAQAGKAGAERAYFVSMEHGYGQTEPAAMPAGCVDAWDEMLAYIATHPDDPRAPEALHWLVHVGHFGGSHDHSGRRAFILLHKRYPNSEWARRTPYYND